MMNEKIENVQEKFYTQVIKFVVNFELKNNHQFLQNSLKF